MLTSRNDSNVFKVYDHMFFVILNRNRGIIFEGENSNSQGEIYSQKEATNKWTEVTLNIAQNILNQKIDITNEDVSKLISKLEENADQFTTSVRFSSFIHQFISKYKPQVLSFLYIFNLMFRHLCTQII